MVTTWPKDFPGLGTSANRLANKINKAVQGQITIMHKWFRRVSSCL